MVNGISSELPVLQSFEGEVPTLTRDVQISSTWIYRGRHDTVAILLPFFSGRLPGRR